MRRALDWFLFSVAAGGIAYGALWAGYLLLRATAP
jgi:hypothetical protein